MITETLLKQIIIEQKELINLSPEHIEREVIKRASQFYNLKHIVVITGHRRAGKSVFLSQIINKYYGIDEVYYLNLDDERLASLKSEDMNKVMEVFHILFGSKKVIFFDEIQELEGWERFVSRLYNQGFKIYITGSNA
jgi:predicted AAA+ superfamily ATPase